MLGIVLDRGSQISLSRQLFIAVQQNILNGTLKANEPLPSTRSLAKDLGVSRNTVSEAYEMLATECYIASNPGSSSRVCSGLNLNRVIQQKKAEASYTENVSKTVLRADFKTGQPDLNFFPRTVWGQCLREALLALPVDKLGYGGAKGFYLLRQEIAHWLLRSRGLEVSYHDIMICSGTTQALNLLTDLLHQPEHEFVLEHPSHQGLHTVLGDKGYPVRPIPVDTQGLDVHLLPQTQISAVYITPSHQFPLGGILPASRRSQLVRLAAEQDFYVIEDDYDSEFRYCGAPISPVYALAPDRVIYVGSFSKTLFPALRIGFVILPKALQQRWCHYRTFMDVQNSISEQAALALFLQKRKMDRHIRQMRNIYAEKRQHLLHAIHKIFGSQTTVLGDASGLHLVLHLPDADFSAPFAQQALVAGIRINPVINYCTSPDGHQDKLLLGYGHLTHKQIEEGVQVLHQFCQRYRF